VENYDQLR